MSDFMEYADYYKKVWEKNLMENTKETEERLYAQIIRDLNYYGYSDAAKFLENQKNENNKA